MSWTTFQEILPYLTLLIATVSSVTSLIAVKTSTWIARNDTRIRLFEERMKVYRAFDNLLSEANQNFTVSHESLVIAHKIFQTAPFIFSNDDIDNYLKNFIQKIIRLNNLNSINSSDNNTQCIDEMMEIQNWIVEQNKRGKKLFKKHMKLLNTLENGYQP